MTNSEARKRRSVFTDAKHVTKNNPNGTVSQCARRDLHEAHEYQNEFGAYFDVHCPGNDGTKP